MRPYTDDAIQSCLRYVRFNPNAVEDDDEDEEMDEEDVDDDFDDDDEFEADAEFDDDDDASWKVRRCAAKTLCTIISTRSSGDLLDSGVLYLQVAPLLVKRFEEPEENVRLEIISAMSLLVRKTGEGIIPEFSIDNSQKEFLTQPPSRKRRRQSSGGGTVSLELAMTGPYSSAGVTSPVVEKMPAAGPRVDLAALTPNIVKASAKLLKGKSIPTKQAIVNLLDDVIAVQGGGLDAFFDQILNPVIAAIKPSSTAVTSSSISAGGNASATASTLRVAALRLTGDIAKHHSSTALKSYLSSIVTSVVGVVDDRYYKISAEAIQTAEEIVKAITPPRSRLTAQNFKTELEKLYDVIIDRTTANDADAEVRQKAIHALGTLLSRTSGNEGANLVSEDKRKAALGFLLERLKNEITRLAAVRAVDDIATMSATGKFEPGWIQQVVVELADQLRKADRPLRGSSIMALKHLVLSPAAAGSLDDSTIQSIVTSLIPVIHNNDAQLLGPGLLVLAQAAKERTKLVATEQVISALCKLLQSSVAGIVIDSLLVLVTTIGQAGHGRALMEPLLKEVGVNGDPTVVGKVIGTTLVASGDSAGVSLDNFVQEVKSHVGDQARASLGLAVLGEAGLRLGKKFPIQPQIFFDQFQNEFDRVSISAAVALGRAGAGNVEQYVPVILKAFKTTSQYLLLQSIKEILQQAAVASTDINEFSAAIWDQLLAAASVEDNKAVCAECIGRMVIIDPKIYMPKLDVSDALHA
jgi:cullin-associated NEDD8-dissociated protein 1